MGNIITAIDNFNKKIIIDIDKLKSYDRIKNARVFTTLFKINEKSEFGNYPMKTNKDGHITILKDLDISNTDWYNLIQFLENGLIKLNHLDKNESIKLIENVNITSIKLGGFPSFDNFYKDFYNKIKNYEFYNPLDPREDKKQLYIWDLQINDNINFRKSHKIEDGWLVTKHYRPPTSSTNCVWWRKIK